MTKVFVSSTVFDLIDIRAEVECLLRDLGLIPVMSGSATSAFQPLPDANSIETCLANLRQCDATIIILCKRYGPSLEAAGFDDVSATHLEYLEARRMNKPIYLYVRDRLEADFAIWKKNKSNVLKPIWVNHDSAERLFGLLTAHRELSRNAGTSNWFDTFRDSVELKALIKRDFGRIALRKELESLVANNQVPLISTRFSADIDPSFLKLTDLTVSFRNVGSVPAYQLSSVIEKLNANSGVWPLLAPGEEMSKHILVGQDIRAWDSKLTVKYFMSQGHFIEDEYGIGFKDHRNGLFTHGVHFISKVHHVGNPDSTLFVIKEGD